MLSYVGATTSIIPILYELIFVGVTVGLERGFELRLPANFVVKRRDAVSTPRRT